MRKNLTLNKKSSCLRCFPVLIKFNFFKINARKGKRRKRILVVAIKMSVSLKFTALSSREKICLRKLGYNLFGRFMTQQAHGYDPFVSFYYIIFLIVLFSC